MNSIFILKVMTLFIISCLPWNIVRVYWYNIVFPRIHDLPFATFQLVNWFRTRPSYFSKSWIYTTNHKRIAINYFTFIFVSGTAGMGLATVIRLEFAYPGVGILAGDSLQYLSIATAHGVIMVFFMIMPSLFGAFGNFLLPTQLGVHDVAFPRLNSAAFWFLPGGLIMLLQLVCIDRRYQRMNCFNIRELQSLLKRRFFVDLVNSADHHTLLNNTLLNTRYKLNSTDTISQNITLFYNYGVWSSPIAKSSTLLSDLTKGKWYNTYNYLYEIFSLPFEYLYDFFIIGIYEVISDLLFCNIYPEGFFDGTYGDIIYMEDFLFYSPSDDVLFFLVDLIQSFHLVAFLTLHNILYVIFDIIPWNFSSLYELPNYINYRYFLGVESTVAISPNFYSTYKTQINHISTLDNLENSNSVRFSRFNNPLLTFASKYGNYIGKRDKMYPDLIASVAEVAYGSRKPVWFFSTNYWNKFVAIIDKSHKFFINRYPNSGLSEYREYPVEFWKMDLYSKSTLYPGYSGKLNASDTYFNTIAETSSDYINLRWISFGSLSQKFYKMFNSSTVHTQVLANWRQLKFSREAWRCKLLISRHQNSLHKRFVSGESFLWTLDRNAKDLLPGWAMITPFSARTRYTTIGKTDVGLMGVLIVLNASIISSANFLVTYRYLSTLNNRKMRDARSFFAESLIVSSWMMIAANPMLIIAIIMLLSDRHWQTSFFDYSGGGDTVLFQHMFWFFGHPEVYVIMIPVFGFANTIMSYYLRKRVSARSSLMYSMYTIAFLGFFVWGHHMYMVGLAHTTRMLFSTLTVMISVPAATKLMHWCVTLVNSYFTVELPFLWAFTFIFFFISGGVSGMCVAHTGMDVLFHDTFYVIGHFHVMLAGSGMMGIFAAFYFYLPAIYGVRYSRIYAYIHYFYYVLGQLLTVIPMMWLGYCGQPRRVLDYPSSLGGWHAIASAGHLLSVFAMISFFLMIFDSIRQAKPTIRNTFGAGRFNTRLNFYLFEVNRLDFVQKKNFHNHRVHRDPYKSKLSLSPLSLAAMDTTLFSYRFYL